jgi:site-specific DNA-methyltransferase (adenine-specific)
MEYNQILLQGDCLDVLDSIDTNKINLVICDLPYGATDNEWDNKINLQELWKHFKRVCTNNCAYIFFTTTRFGYDLITSNPKWFRYDLVWNKDKPTGFLTSKKQPMRGHEMIYVFYNKLPFYNIADNHEYRGKHSGKPIKSLVYKTELHCTHGPQWTPLLPRSVLSFAITNKKKNKLHSTEKPLDLIKWIIRYYSKENDVIFDPTFGCGTTAVACKELNRSFIGIEKDEQFFNLAQQRIDETN